MSKYETRRTTLDDLFMLVQDTPEAQLWSFMDRTKVEYLLSQDSYSGFADGQLVACGGLISVWPGLAEAWIAITPLAKDHARFVYTSTKLYLEDRIKRFDLKRIQSTVRADFSKALTFATRLGFLIHPTPLFNYGPQGETFRLVSKVI